MLNYEVDPGLLLEFVPPGTELDTWNGKTFLTLVGFQFLKTKVRGISVPFHRDFEEVNLRFYVRRTGVDGVKRGVVFIREIVPSWLTAAVARAFYNERYVAAPMSHRVERTDAGLSVEYEWKFSRSKNKIKVKAKGDPAVPQNGSQEQFITEHYWGYASRTNGGCIEYRVEHPPWNIWTASDAVFDVDMEDLYGKELNAVLKHSPESVFLAEGSPVTVYRCKRL